MHGLFDAYGIVASKHITCMLQSGWKRYDDSKVPPAGDSFIIEGGCVKAELQNCNNQGNFTNKIK